MKASTHPLGTVYIVAEYELSSSRTALSGSLHDPLHCNLQVIGSLSLNGILSLRYWSAV